jgi:hypothetical protein
METQVRTPRRSSCSRNGLSCPSSKSRTSARGEPVGAAVEPHRSGRQPPIARTGRETLPTLPWRRCPPIKPKAADDVTWGPAIIGIRYDGPARLLLLHFDCYAFGTGGRGRCSTNSKPVGASRYTLQPDHIRGNESESDNNSSERERQGSRGLTPVLIAIHWSAATWLTSWRAWCPAKRQCRASNILPPLTSCTIAGGRATGSASSYMVMSSGCSGS